MRFYTKYTAIFKKPYIGYTDNIAELVVKQLDAKYKPKIQITRYRYHLAGTHITQDVKVNSYREFSFWVHHLLSLNNFKILEKSFSKSLFEYNPYHISDNVYKESALNCLENLYLENKKDYL